MNIDDDLCETIEDALVSLQKTVFNPKKVGQLIRKNLQRNIRNEYRIVFYTTPEGDMRMEASMIPSHPLRLLGKKIGLR